jgi:ATP-dependent DNA ligase
MATTLSLPLKPPLEPMEAQSVSTVPIGEEWLYEPKWDGFRCLVFRDGDSVYLQSKAGKPLARYFPDVVHAIAEIREQRFALDGELVVPFEGRLSFEQLQLRLHPAASRVAMLAAAHPARLIAFDLLAEKDRSLLERPLAKRRAALETFAQRQFAGASLDLSPASSDPEQALAWLQEAGPTLDGIMAKRLEQPYLAGERGGMVKVKNLRTIDCVVGGFRYLANGRIVGSLLLGLYDDSGRLHHVGHLSGIREKERADLTKTLEKLAGPPGFTGAAPGGPSRWSRGKETAWEPLRPKLVVEVAYDHFTGGRFRHGSSLVRWRPDKAPRQCRFDQIPPAGQGALQLLETR